MRSRLLIVAIQLAAAGWLQVHPCAADTIPENTSDPVQPTAKQRHVARVRFTSDDENAMLQQHSGRVWKSLCRESCDMNLSVPTELRVAGNGVTSSDPFTLQPGRSFHIDANTAPGGRNLWGWAVLGSGAILAGTGALMVSMDPVQGDSSLQTLGAIELVVGGASMLIGLLLLANSTTDVAVTQTASTHHPQVTRSIPYAISF